MTNRELPFHKNGLFLAVWFIFLFSIAVAVAGTVRITVLHTTDVHGNLIGAGITRDEQRHGGLLRCATLIERIRAEEANVILLDCGDLFQGSVESYLSDGLAVADVVRALRYDGLVVGNHEFDWGYEKLWAFYRRAGVPPLAADIFYESDGMDNDGRVPHPEKAPGRVRPEQIKPFIVKDMDGVRVLVVGLSNPHIPYWFTRVQLGHLSVIDSIDALRGVFPHLRAQRPDIIILAVHQGYLSYGDNPANRINALAAAFPELDVIIGGHTHTGIDEIQINGILYTQTAPYGRQLGRIDLEFDRHAGELQNRRAGLITVTPETDRHPRLTSLVSDAMESARNEISAVIGEAAASITPRQIYPGQSGIQTLICRAVAGRTGAEVVIHGTLSTAEIHAGAIRGGDIWRVIPYENTIGIAQLTVGEITEILLENARYVDTPQFRGVYGMTYTLDVSSATPEIENIKIGGKPAASGRRYRVAFNSFDLASAGNRLPVLRALTHGKAARLHLTGLDTRKVVKEYVAGNPGLAISPLSGAELKK